LAADDGVAALFVAAWWPIETQATRGPTHQGFLKNSIKPSSYFERARKQSPDERDARMAALCTLEG
jgi:hypothetical protein